MIDATEIGGEIKVTQGTAAKVGTATAIAAEGVTVTDGEGAGAVTEATAGIADAEDHPRGLTTATITGTIVAGMTEETIGEMTGATVVGLQGETTIVEEVMIEAAVETETTAETIGTATIIAEATETIEETPEATETKETVVANVGTEEDVVARTTLKKMAPMGMLPKTTTVTLNATNLRR